jgi:histidine kinase
MITVPGYEVMAKLYESSRSLLYRGQRNSDQMPVVLKMLRQEYPSPDAIARFQMEYNILSNLDLPGVIKAYSLVTDQQNYVIVLEDFGGESLQAWLQKRSFSLAESLTLAVQITTTLGEIHQHHLIHKDINPANILFNAKTGMAKIIDFGIASSLSRERPTLCHPAVLAGTLAYMSPEQTGRMNRAIDYRTDFYALGVTLYQLLCDRLPFTTTDVLELVHCHIAKQPIPPHEIKPAIPRSLSDVVMKLLAKNAADRYQSPRGICADLQLCLSQLQAHQPLAAFPIGQWDRSPTWQIPQKLYGRAREVEQLHAVLECLTTKTAPPHSALVLVTGPPGIGKTSLVQELCQPLTRQPGYFIAGKYEQLQRHLPYSGLIQAWRELLRQLLTEPAESIGDWREQLLTALGDQAAVIRAVIPEIALLIGQPPKVPELPPAEAQNRFYLVLEKFIRVFTQLTVKTASLPPLMIFLDDLQWADRASLRLIQRWLTEVPDQRLLLIGAYRDQELTAAHPLVQSLDAITTAGGAIHRITLSPLGLADVMALMQDTFHCESAQSQPLAELTQQKTAGNPFFINEFLCFLHQEKLIDFNQQQGIWEWDLAKIRAAHLTDNVVELVADRLQALPLDSQRVLSLAACMGHQFNLQMLALVSGQSLLETATQLDNATQATLITPLGDVCSYLIADQPEQRPDCDVTYKFLHDRIQQAAYALISELDRSYYHHKIGQLIQQSTPPELLEDQIFTIVDHLNLGTELMTTVEQRHELARLNLIAGQKAQRAIAYESALNYLHQGRSLLAIDSWQTAYELTLSLCESAAKAAYLAGDLAQMEQRVAEVLQHAKTVVAKTQVYLTKIQADIAQDRFLEAIQLALLALDGLGVKIPAHPDAGTIARARAETKCQLAQKPVVDLLQLPRMADAHKLAAMAMIASVCTPTYFLAPDLWQLMVFQKVQLSLNYGNAPGSAFGYADYGMIQCGVEDNLAAATQFAQLAVQLQAQLDAPEFVPRTALLVNMYLKPWQEHLQETLHPLLEAYQSGLATGDLEYATFAIACRFYHSYLLGRDLAQLEQEMASYAGAIAQFKQLLPWHLMRMYRQSVLNLITPTEDPSRLLGPSYNEVESLPQLLAANDNYLLFHLYLNKLMLCYLFQQTAPAVAHANTAAQLLAAGAIGLLVVPVFYFYESLAQMAIFPELTAAEQYQILQKVATNQTKMNHWADHAPMNYRHKFHLVAAERYRLLGQDAEAADAYDRAIDLAQAHAYLNEAALANELAGRFYLAKGKAKIAQAYLLEARYYYLRWGATTKVSDLDRRYPQFYDRLPERITTITPSHLAPATSSTAALALDWAALMKAAQVLAGEMELDKLLAKLMTILMANSGAQRGCLLLERDRQLAIAAAADAETNQPPVMLTIPIASEMAREQVALTIVNYVARTQESVVLNQATHDDRFSQDAYILSHQPKSILCTPLVYQGKCAGILYLENNLTTEAFTPQRLEILQFLSTQAAIALDNAQLYNQLEQRVQERTIALTAMNDRLQTEILERQRSEQTLRMIVAGTAAVTGADFFRSLVRSLAQALGVRYAFISECLDALPTRVRSFAFWQGDEFGNEFEYDLTGTPCEQIINSKSCQCFPDHLQARFPNDQDLATMQAQSYAAIALLDSTGNLLGHLAILDDQPLANEARTKAILEIFAARAAAEMERQQAEEALRVSETKFATAFRSSPEAITISTLNDGCYIEINESSLRMLGYSREEMMGRSALELGIWANPADREAIKHRLQQQGSVTNLETQLRRKSGEIFPALFSAEVIRLEDEPCLLAVAADITMLKQAEKALARLAEIGELAAMIVHEVRNPLTTITMGLTAFKKLQLSERFQEYLTLSLDEADRLQRLLSQILLYSREQTLQRSPVELNSLIAETLNMLQTIPAAVGKHLKMIAATEPVPVLADPDKLKQIVINLVTNACEAVNAGAIITVHIQTTENHQGCLQIHNGGAPIPVDILPQLTQPFFTTKASGTGLGLAIVKRIIEAHAGEFTITSDVATGTIVTVKLPMA